MKNKKSKKELTRLIMAALILGGGCLYGPVAEAGSVTVTSDETVNYVYNGTKSNNSNEPDPRENADDHTTTVYGTVIGKGYSQAGDLNGGTFGGLNNNSSSGTANRNKVIIYAGARIYYDVFGGRGYYANDNTVTINGGYFSQSNIYGGYTTGGTSSGTANNNTVNINATVSGIATINGGSGSGNVLNLGGLDEDEGLNTGNVYNFDKIVLGYTDTKNVSHPVTFKNNAYVLKASGQVVKPNSWLDISGMTIPAANYGTMTLLSGKQESQWKTSLTGITVKYGTGDNDKVHLTQASPSAVVGGTSVDNDTVNNVTLHYKTDVVTAFLNTNTYNGQFPDLINNEVKLSRSADKTPVTEVTLGAMTWGTGRTDGSSYTFNSSTAINASNLTFTGSFNSNPINQTTTLLSNANGIKDSTTAKAINLAASFQDANGVGYSGAATNGNVISSNTNKNITYKVTGATLNSLNLAGWNGSTSTLLSGWTNNSSGVNVTASFTNLPNIGTDVSRIIMTTNGKTGFFSDDKITGNNKYKTSGSIVDVPVAGVTLSGNTAGGVTTTNSGADLIYYATKNDVTGITLGSTTWGAKRDINNNAAYDFSGVTSIDASGLTFTGTATINGFTDSTNILTNATGLAYAGAITQPTNKTFNISYTDNNTKITYKGQATNGSLTRDNTNLKYTISAGKVNEIDLGQWNGTAAPALPNTWDTPSGGVAVDTGDFESPTGTDNVDIFTTTEDGFFNENNITGDKKYKDNEPMPDDKKDGVTISGTKSGGIAPSEDGLTPTTSGKRLTYFAESTTGSKISLGEVAWTKAGTARALTGNYNFSNLVNNDVDATGLKFTFANSSDDTSVNKIAAGDTMTILAGATGLNSGLTVAGSPKSQAVSYGINNVANLSGTLTGNVTTTANTVNYEVTSKTLDSVDISSWDGSTSEAVDGSWTRNSSGINVTGSGFTAPTTLGDTPILTATGGLFADAKIADSIKYQPSGKYTEKEQNITLSGKQAKGVQTADSDNKLVYSIGAAYIDNLQLGKVTYNKNAELLDKSSAMYNFSYLTSLDTSGFGVTMTDDQKKTAQANDSMKLVHANATLTDIAAKEAGTNNYSYAPTSGMTVGGSVVGQVLATNNDVLYQIKENKASTLDITNVQWDNTYARPNDEITYSTAVVDSSNIKFTGVDNLTTGQTMILVSNYGDSVTKTRAGVFTLDDGRTGKGTAYYDTNTKNLMYKVTLGSGETQPTVNVTGHTEIFTDGGTKQGTINGGEAKGDGESTGNGAEVKGTIITNDDGTGGDVFGGTSEDGPAKNNTADVEDSEVAGDVIGGQSDNGPSTENKAKVKDSKIHGDADGGRSNGDGDTTKNEIFVEGGGTTIDGDVNGGHSGGNGNSDENKTDVKGGAKVKGNVNGGHTNGHGHATGNEVFIEGGGTTIDGDVNGGKSDTDGDTDKNKVNVKNGSKVGGDVNGGHTGGNGHANENTVDIDGGTVDKDVNGGKTDGNGDAKNNKTDVKGGSKVGGSVTGGSSGGSGEASGNETTIEGKSEIGGDVTGGKSGSGGTKDNKADVKEGSKVGGSVIGGSSGGSGESTGNKANVEGGSEVQKDVIGGQSENGNTDKNEATVTGKSKVNGDVTGGKNNGNGTSSENKATVAGGSEIGGSVTGGQSVNGNTNKNEVSVSDGSTVNGSVFGGKTTGSGSADNNTVNIASSTIKGSLSGGDSNGGSASGNTVTVNNTNVGTDTSDGNIYGGKTAGVNKPADTNTVSLTGGTVKGGVFGGYSENGSAANNKVTVNGTTIRDYIYGGKSKYLSQNDEVYFKNGSVMGIIGGGCEESLNNLAELSDGTVEEHVLGGFATGTDGIAKGNKVQKTGGTVKGSVIGGYGNGTAEGNTVYLSGGTVQGNTITSAILGNTIVGGVYGGYGTGSTKNNSIYLYGTADVSNTALIGGTSEATGNILNIGYMDNGTATPWTGGGQSVKDIKNFESLSFSVVPWSTSQSGIQITDGTNSDLSMTTVSAKDVVFTGTKSLAVNDTMTLLDQSKANKKATSLNTTSNFTVGTVGEGTGTLSLDNKENVIYKVETVHASEQTHSTVMDAAAGMTSLLAGNEFIDDSIKGLALQESIGTDGIATYAKLGGSDMRQETGSHVNLHTWNGILAVGHKNDKKKSSFEYGAFLEYGTGSYTTFNGQYRGDGSSRYSGGGVLGKWQHKDGMYVEGSLRGGRIHSDANNLLRDGLGNGYSYTTDAPYWGIHLGVGKEIQVNKTDTLDVYAKYFFNRRGDVSFDAGGHYELDAVSSNVLRVGTRYTVKKNKNFNYYGGLAVEHEFSGVANGTADGMAIRSADISGTSLRWEIGATFQPDDKTPMTLDLNLTGFAGQKRGLAGGVSALWHF
ncbi:autotransporter outer membrane beta-barrel domain-containing protein [Anaerovibrio sp. RM50]|uniref:autotransporter outer membrane beta-barrel domain-containing protein n=1 Tax=Anaerovibrio sp. RM50 TaxID=1200557 RepID=UPI0004823E6F|nr:autotransporter outer membrane beta-barrel domain-containing protein [Anaerovibrio sp. RM50]